MPKPGSKLELLDFNEEIFKNLNAWIDSLSTKEVNRNSLSSVVIGTKRTCWAGGRGRLIGMSRNSVAIWVGGKTTF